MAVAALAGWLAASGALDATANDKGVIAPGAALSKRGERHSATSVLHDSLLELHSTRVQGITCKHTGAIPTGLARRCDWVLMNSTNAGLIKYRSPPRCALRSANSLAPCFESPPPPLPPIPPPPSLPCSPLSVCPASGRSSCPCASVIRRWTSQLKRFCPS